MRARGSISVRAFSFASTLSPKDPRAILEKASATVRATKTQVVAECATSARGSSPTTSARSPSWASTTRRASMMMDAILKRVGPEPHPPMEEAVDDRGRAPTRSPREVRRRRRARDRSQGLVELVGARRRPVRGDGILRGGRRPDPRAPEQVLRAPRADRQALRAPARATQVHRQRHVGAQPSHLHALAPRHAAARLGRRGRSTASTAASALSSRSPTASARSISSCA